MTSVLAVVITYSNTHSGIVFPIKNENTAAYKPNWKTSIVALYLSIQRSCVPVMTLDVSQTSEKSPITSLAVIPAAYFG